MDMKGSKVMRTAVATDEPDSAALLLEEVGESLPESTSQDRFPTRSIAGLGTVALALLGFIAVLNWGGQGQRSSFRANGAVELTVVERANESQVSVTTHKASTSSTPKPAPWQCARYVGEQNNTWCKSVGNSGGWEYEFFGEESPCDDCFCCKRPDGTERKCASEGANCLDDECCETPGFQCFQKTPYWGRCRQWCTPGPDPTDTNSDHWSCEEIGDRAEGDAPPQDYSLQAAPWVAAECAGQGGNCSASMCCQEAGLQCYTKADGWASCKAACTPGPDPIDADNHPWECKELGSRTPGATPGYNGPPAQWVEEVCSAGGEDCSKSGCCKDPGNQCYLKQPGWAMCMPSCLHGPLLTDSNPDIWDCTPLGGRTPGLAKASAEVHVADWVATQCAADGESCSKQMCCSNPTSQCFEKNEGWAVCMRGCAPGVHEFDDEHPWSCNGLGPRTPRAWGHPSLYCFSVVQIYSGEGDTIKTQLNTDGGAGIFACEQFDVFSSDGGVYLGDGPAGPVWSQYFENAAVGTTIDGTAGNTRLFINVWEAVKIVGRFWSTDWLIKADPDAVLIPDRLRSHLSAHMGRPTYIITCTLPGMTPMMFGAVEAISKGAMAKYYENRDVCMGLPVDAWGEDRWISSCLNQIGAPGEEDFAMVSDGVCHGVSCGSGAAAFHPFKSAGAWQGCYYEAIR